MIEVVHAPARPSPAAPADPAASPLLAALPMTFLIVSPAGVVLSSAAGDGAPVEAPAAGTLVFDALAIDPDGELAGAWTLWLACALGDDLSTWELHLPDAPRAVPAAAARPGLEVEVGPVVERGVVVGAALAVRRARPATALGTQTVATLPAADADGARRAVADARSLLEDCEAELTRLARDREARHAVHRLFRALHTVKGLAGGIGQPELVALARRGEDVLERVRGAGAPVDDAALALVRTVIAELRVALAGAGARAGTDDALTVLYREARPLLPLLERAVAAWSAQPRLRGHGDDLERRLRAIARAAQQARCLGLEARIAELRTEVARAREAARAPRGLLAAIEHGLDDLGQWLRLYHDLHAELRNHAEPAEAATALATALAASDGPDRARRTMEAEARRLGVLCLGPALAGDDAAVRRALTAVADLPAMLAPADPHLGQLEAARGLERAFAALVAATRAHPLAGVLRGELAAVRAAIADLAWQPIDDVAERVTATARAAAAELGKPVDVVLDAPGVRVPEPARRALADILVHAVRNAIAHGIEPGDQRALAGKPARGAVVVRIEADHAWARVAVRDDGRGVDLERVRARGVELGLLSPGVDVNDAEVLEVLFAPGFSTATTVDDVAGRGVGMDVIRAVARAHGGDAGVRTAAGRGTEVHASLRLSAELPDG